MTIMTEVVLWVGGDVDQGGAEQIMRLLAAAGVPAYVSWMTLGDPGEGVAVAASQDGSAGWSIWEADATPADVAFVLGISVGLAERLARMAGVCGSGESA